MTQTANITTDMVRERSTKIAVELRAKGYPVMGCDEADMFHMVGITFRVSTGQLVDFRLHYDLAEQGRYEALFKVFEGPV